MKYLIVLVVVGVCAAVPPFTYEVQQARNQFFRAYDAAAAKARAASPNQHAISFPVAAAQPVYTTGWTGPVAATIPAGVPGSQNVQQTADFLAAERVFQSAYNAAVLATRPAAQSHYQAFPAGVHHIVSNVIPAVPLSPRWTGPVAATIPAGLPGSGNVGDTPEVSAAKRSFADAFARQLALTGGFPPSRF